MTALNKFGTVSAAMAKRAFSLFATVIGMCLVAFSIALGISANE